MLGRVCKTPGVTPALIFLPIQKCFYRGRIPVRHVAVVPIRFWVAPQLLLLVEMAVGNAQQTQHVRNSKPSRLVERYGWSPGPRVRTRLLLWQNLGGRFAARFP